MPLDDVAPALTGGGRLDLDDPLVAAMRHRPKLAALVADLDPETDAAAFDLLADLAARGFRPADIEQAQVAVADALARKLDGAP